MEIRGMAWRPGDLKQFYKTEYFWPAAYGDQAAIVEAETDRVRAELIADSGTKYDPDIYYKIPSCEYKSLINDVREKALKEGREEAWDLARRIAITGPDCYSIDEVNTAFGDLNIFRTPVEEVLAKDKEYQEKKKALHVGDEVEFKSYGREKRGYIVNLIDPAVVRVLTKDHGTYTAIVKDCEKTGKHSEEIEKAMALFEEGERDD